MPRNVRNFWITVEVDGRLHKVETGPRAKDGGFVVRIYQRGAPDACNAPVLTVQGKALDNGNLAPGTLETRAWIRPNTDQQHQIGLVRTHRQNVAGVDSSIEWTPCK